MCGIGNTVGQVKKGVTKLFSFFGGESTSFCAVTLDSVKLVVKPGT